MSVNKQQNWQPWETRPRDGKYFIAYNGKSMRILNHPQGYELGYWNKYKKEWFGSFEFFENPTHWMPLPKRPKNEANENKI